jgi:hypothetical protein
MVLPHRYPEPDPVLSYSQDDQQHQALALGRPTNLEVVDRLWTLAVAGLQWPDSHHCWPLDADWTAVACPADGTNDMASINFKIRAGRLIDRRTWPAQQRARVAAALTAELGEEASPGELLSIGRAATLIVLAEDATTRRLAGDNTISIDDCVRLSSEARRALRALGLGHPQDDDEPEQPFGGIVMAPSVYGHYEDCKLVIDGEVDPNEK